MTAMTEHRPEAPARKRSGSGRRRRTAAAFVRLLPAELEAIEVRAKAAGRPVAGYLRDCALAESALPVAAALTAAQCEALRRLAGEWGEAIGAVRSAVDLLGARIHSAEDARVIAGAREALKVLEGAEADSAAADPRSPAPAAAEPVAAILGAPGGKDGSGDDSADIVRDPMWYRRYWDVQAVLDEALGTGKDDGSEGGIAGDVALLAGQRDHARRAAARRDTELEDAVRERNTAEEKLARIATLCRDSATSAWGGATPIVAAERVLAIIGSEEESRPASRPCPRCEGCGQQADTDDREPWTAWTSLPLRSSAAVLAGLVKPVPCDACGGTGRTRAPDRASGRVPGTEAGLSLIAAERARQVAVEGYTPEHDAEHAHGELARAGAVYALWAVKAGGVNPHDPMKYWPRDWRFKGGEALDHLVKAGALIAAEIDRIVAEEARRD
jgi:hypothetical protein